jgi:hypothetical protein
LPKLAPSLRPVGQVHVADSDDGQFLPETFARLLSFDRKPSIKVDRRDRIMRRPERNAGRGKNWMKWQKGKAVKRDETAIRTTSASDKMFDELRYRWAPETLSHPSYKSDNHENANG